jgi:hypothetical protein
MTLLIEAGLIEYSDYKDKRVTKQLRRAYFFYKLIMA